MNLLDRLREKVLADNDLLRKNDHKGDVFETPRDVDFTFKTEDPKKAEDLASYINGMNFGIATVQHGDGNPVWVVVVIRMPITQHLLCSVSAFMVCLGRIYGAEYDGWGSVLQPK